MQTRTAAVYCPALSLLPLAIIAFNGLVKQVETVPTVATTNDPKPQTTVINSGTTSSTIACHVRCGEIKMGAAIVKVSLLRLGASAPSAMQAGPVIIVTISSGQRLARLGKAEMIKNASVMGPAILGSVSMALAQSRLNYKNTPATIETKQRR
jgi:hypothetical protein